MMNCSPIPGFNPVLFDGPWVFDLRWYALAYIAGLVLGWRYYLRLQRKPALWQPGANPKSPFSADDVDELLVLATLGVIIGGRLGYVLFYMHQTNPGWWLVNGEFNLVAAFLRAINITAGGMSFHGGLLGVGAAMGWLAYSRKLSFLRIADGAAAVTPIGLFFGRIANFINGELYGRETTVSWAMAFPCDQTARELGIEPLLRHPSQLYEAVLEGLVLFIILRVMTHRFNALQRPGLITGAFLIGYGVFRSFVEIFREPDSGLEALPFGMTMGMILSAPMWIGGAYLIWRALRTPPHAAATA